MAITVYVYIATSVNVSLVQGMQYMHVYLQFPTLEILCLHPLPLARF